MQLASKYLRSRPFSVQHVAVKSIMLLTPIPFSPVVVSLGPGATQWHASVQYGPERQIGFCSVTTSSVRSQLPCHHQEPNTGFPGLNPGHLVLDAGPFTIAQADLRRPDQMVSETSALSITQVPVPKQGQPPNCHRRTVRHDSILRYQT